MGKPVNKTLQIAAMSGGVELGHVSGPIASFRGNGDPLRSLLVSVEPVQSGSGDPSPDNVRPISGWSAVNVWRTGKNLFDVGNASGWEVPSGGEIAVSNNTVSIKILGSGGTKYWRSQNITLTGNVTISQKATCNNSRIYIRLRKLDDSGWMTSSDATITGMSYNSYYGGWYTNAGASTTFVKSITIPMCLYWNYGTGFDNASATAGDTETVSDIQLELGSTATAYAPYSGNQYTLQLGQTVYGGTLDVTNGVLTVTHKMVNFDNYTGTISKSASAYIPSGRAFYWIKLSGSPNPGGDGNPNHIYMKSSIYDIQDKSYLNMFQLSEFAMSIGRDTSICMVGFNVDDSLSTVDLFRAWLQSASCDVWYPLATPITIQLTPTEISSLVGENNVWADTGDVDVTYVAVGGEGGKLALLLRKRKELLIALRKGLTPADAGLLSSTLSTPPSLGNVLSPGAFKPGLTPDIDKEEDDLW